jgi:hypothetical protein
LADLSRIEERAYEDQTQEFDECWDYSSYFYETHDGLVLAPGRKVAAAYIDPEADLGIYNKIMMLDCYVAFKKDWQRDQKRAGSRLSVSSSEMERIKTAVAEVFQEAFVEELSKDGGYEIVDTAGDDVLLVRPAIIDLDVSAPDTMSAGRSRTYTTTAGAATLFIELYDSVSGDILARAADRREARTMGGHLTYSNRVTNKSDASRMMRSWAKLLRERLDEFHGK